METFLESVEVDLRNLSSEARKSDTLAGQLAGWLVNSEHPEVKVAAERGILKIRALARQPVSVEDVKSTKELLRPFLLACETKNTRLTVLALTTVQKLLANNVLSEEGTSAVITTLQHVERSGEEAVKLKMLQIVLTLVQDTKCSSTDGFSSLLGVCFRILSQGRNTDTVLSTAAATIRQVVAVIFDHVAVAASSEAQTAGYSTNEAALLLLEDLCQLAGGSPAVWLQSPAIPQQFALELLDFIIIHKTELFHKLKEFEVALRERVCHVLQQLLNEAFDLESEPGKTFGTYKFTFKVLMSLLTRFYTLIPGKIGQIWEPLCSGASSPQQRWRQICCLQVLKSIASDAQELYFLYQMFDHSKDFVIPAISRVVDVSVELLNPKRRIPGSEEDKRFHTSLNLFFEDKTATPSSSHDEATDEALVSMLALDILLKIANDIHLLAEQCKEDEEKDVFLKSICSAMLDKFWECFFSTFRGYLSLPNVGETVILAVLKGYQDLLPSAAEFELTDAMKAFLYSLCEFSIPSEISQQMECPTLSSLNLQSVRTLLNVVHQLGNTLGPSWTEVVTTLYTLDGILQHHVTDKDTREEEVGLQSDLDVLETSLNQLFEGTSGLTTEAVVCLLSSLRDVSLQTLTTPQGKHRRPSFCFQKMVDVLLKNLERVHDLWGVFLAHVIEVLNTCESPTWTISIEALDRAITGVLEECLNSSKSHKDEFGALENMLLVALESLFSDAPNREIRLGLLKIALHILQRSGESLSRGWDPILRLLQSVPGMTDPEVINTAFDSVELLMNEHLALLASDIRSKCLRVVSAYAKQTSVMNVSLTSINLLWSAVDMVGKEVKTAIPSPTQGAVPGRIYRTQSCSDDDPMKSFSTDSLVYLLNVLQQLSLDTRPEVRNSGIRSFFSALVSYGSKLNYEEWNSFLTDVMLPLLKSVYYISMTSSSEETEAIELGKEKGKSVKMLMHYSRNTERKQWEETMVLALNGLSKILRLYLSLLLELVSFQDVWDQISIICKSSLTQGTRDAALAATALIVQVSETFGNAGSYPTQSLTSLLKALDESMEKITHPDSPTLAIVRLEIAKSIGLIAKSTVRILPEKTRQTFLLWLQKLSFRPSNNEESLQIVPDVIPIAQKETLIVICGLPLNEDDPFWINVVSVLCSFLYPEGIAFGDPLCSPSPPTEEEFHPAKESFAPLWMIHVIEFLEHIFTSKLSVELQTSLFPQIAASLTRCMAAQYLTETEGSGLWLKAGTLFRYVLDVGLASLPEDASHGQKWLRSWDTITSCFEAVFIGKWIQLVSKTGSENLVSLTQASELKLTILDTLTNVIMNFCQSMSDNTLKKSVNLIDVAMHLHKENLAEQHIPSGNLAQSCLRKLFVLCSQTTDDKVAVVALPLFVSRCKHILMEFSKEDQSSNSVQKFSLAKVGEVVFALEMLSTLRVAPAVAESILTNFSLFQRLTAQSALPRSLSSGGGTLRRVFSLPSDMFKRPHLLMIYEELCDCVVSKESTVRSLVSDLLKSIGNDLALM